jgi:hypothetical protein
MEKLRILIDPAKYPEKTESQLKQLVEDAEIVYVAGVDPYIGEAVGQVMILTPSKSLTTPPVARYIPQTDK